MEQRVVGATGLRVSEVGLGTMTWGRDTDALDAEIATRWVVVAETVDSDGEVSLASLCSPGLPMWVRSGMLRWEADTLAGQPLWTDAEDE